MWRRDFDVDIYIKTDRKRAGGAEGGIKQSSRKSRHSQHRMESKDRCRQEQRHMRGHGWANNKIATMYTCRASMAGLKPACVCENESIHVHGRVLLPGFFCVQIAGLGIT